MDSIDGSTIKKCTIDLSTPYPCDYKMECISFEAKIGKVMLCGNYKYPDTHNIKDKDFQKLLIKQIEKQFKRDLSKHQVKFSYGADSV